MARELSTPLTQEDLSYLRQRHTEAYVDRMVELHGAEEARQESENGPESGPEGSEDPTGPPKGEDAGEGTEEAEEDLIGDADQDLFDPKDHTESEIKDHLEAFPGDRDRVIGLEREGRHRKGVLAL